MRITGSKISRTPPANARLPGYWAERDRRRSVARAVRFGRVFAEIERQTRGLIEAGLTTGPRSFE